ncbi:MAG TPA: response regulator transcription factor [Acidimicrobiales bacterium]|nr:response regulator transcription factor [Acidimicrobiales bacterium]
MSSTGDASMTVDVVLVEPRALIRDAVAALMQTQPMFRLAGEAERLRDLAMLDGDPRVVVTSLDLPDGRGPSVVQAVHRYLPSASILVLSDVAHPSIVVQALDAGAIGYILGSASSQQFFTALDSVARKESYVDPSLEAGVAKWQTPSNVAPSTAMRHLSNREIDVLRWLALGHTNAEIATLSGVSLRTVETHRARVFQKLGLRTRADLVRYAFDEGLVDSH